MRWTAPRAMALSLTLALVLTVAPLGQGLGTVRASHDTGPDRVYFPQTGHQLATGFLDQWRHNGGIAVLGYPLTEELNEPGSGRTIQYFERAVFESHPDAPEGWKTQLRRLGADITVARQSETAFQPINAGNDANCSFYAETGHRLCFGFRAYWEQNGGLRNFGYPLSEEFSENGYTVQYFERARFEWHPEHRGTPYEILLGRLGADAATRDGVDTAAKPQAGGVSSYDLGLWSARWPLGRCYQPRQGSDQFDLRPAGPNSIFQNCQVVAYYGFPDIPVMGILGSGSPEAVTARLRQTAAAYDEANGTRGVALALNLVYAVAQGSQTPDGTYLYRMPDATLQRYIRAAEELDLLLILDVQMGHSTVDAEFAHVAEYLKHPRIHLGLDPEFATAPQVPGTVIGSLDGSQIKRAQQLLQQLARQHSLPDKILVVHQFTPGMITNKSAIQDYANVNLVIDQDGFGYAEAKIANYNRYIAAEGAEHGGFKLFYDQDIDLMSPSQVSRLSPQPDLVIYQ